MQVVMIEERSAFEHSFFHERLPISGIFVGAGIVKHFVVAIAIGQYDNGIFATKHKKFVVSYPVEITPVADIRVGRVFRNDSVYILFGVVRQVGPAVVGVVFELHPFY